MADEIQRVRTIYTAEGLEKVNKDLERSYMGHDALAAAAKRSKDALVVSESQLNRSTASVATFGGTVGRVAMGIGAAVAGLAIGAGIGGAKLAENMFDLQVAAENTRISFAGMMSAGGAKGAEDFQMSMAMSEELLKKMREHAKLLPGDFNDLNNVMQRSMLSGLGGGKSVNEIESMSARVMAVGKALNMNSIDTGSGFEMMLQGRAGMHSPLWAKLKNLIGMDAQQFNSLDFDKKWQAIDKALKGFDPMIKEYEKSWDAVSSTARDHLNNLMRIAGGGFFQGIKDGVNSFNDAVEINNTMLEKMAENLGKKIGGAFGWALGAARSFFGYLQSSGVFDRISGVTGAIGSLFDTSSNTGGAGNDGFNAFMSSVKDLAATIWDTVKPAFEAVWESAIKLRPLFTQLWNIGGMLVDALSNLFSQVADVAGVIGSKLLSALVMLGNGLVFVFEQIGKLFPEFAKSISDNTYRTQSEDTAGAMASEVNRYELEKRGFADALNNAFGNSMGLKGYGVLDPTRVESNWGPMAYNPSRAETDAMLARQNLDAKNAVKKPPQVTVNATITQNIANAANPEIVAVKTQEALERAFKHPIESHDNVFSVLR